MQNIDTPSQFFLKQMSVVDSLGKPHFRDCWATATVEGTVRRRGRRNDFRDVRREFVPLDTTKRFQIAFTFYCPPSTCSAIRGDYMAGKIGERKYQRLLTECQREFVKELRAMPLPDSYVQPSPHGKITNDFMADEKPRTRAAGLAAVAMINSQAVRVKGKACKGWRAEWAVLVEIGEALNPGIASLYMENGDIGCVTRDIAAPVRLVRPTATELERYRIDWSKLGRKLAV